MQSGFYIEEAISIHAPRTGSDQVYNSTFRGYCISIHAPRTGSDVIWVSVWARRYYFNPRSPHGERRARNVASLQHWRISIHAPRTGSDAKSLGGAAGAAKDFNPRSPHGERHNSAVVHLYKRAISIHAPRTGSDG